VRPDPLLTSARSRSVRQVCKFSDTQSSAMQKGIKFAKEVLEAYGCQVRTTGGPSIQPRSSGRWLTLRGGPL
jgi:hypothetical protein